MCLSDSLLGKSSAGAGSWVRNHIRYSRSPASSVISRSYVGSRGQTMYLRRTSFKIVLSVLWAKVCNCQKRFKNLG